jgi:nucleoside-diphosphate-sugar epimerase
MAIFRLLPGRGVPVVIVRLFNTVGPRQTGRYGMVLPTFARQALRGEPITVYGSGQQSRCFAHVRDVVEALLRLLTTPAGVGEVFNIGSTEEVTILELAKRVREAARSSSPIVLVPYEQAYTEGFEDMPRRVPDVRKLERFTGYRPMTQLAQIIADVVADQRGRITEEIRGPLRHDDRHICEGSASSAFDPRPSVAVPARFPMAGAATSGSGGSGARLFQCLFRRRGGTRGR